MRNYDKTDLAFYKNTPNGFVAGDLSVDLEGDLSLTDNILTIAQDIQNRMRTQRQDWYFHENIGADLELFIGEKNNPITAGRIEESALKTLTYDGLVSEEDVEVEVIPVGANDLEIFVFLQSDPNEEPQLVFNEMIRL